MIKKSITFYLIKIAVSLGIMAMCMGIVFLCRGYQEHQKEKLLDLYGRHVKGLDSAPIQIIEYVDFRCGPCAYASRFLKGFLAQHPQEVRLEARFFPIHTGHDILSFRYAECAGRQQRFWAFHDRLMGRQREWIRLRDPEPFYLKIADQLGLDKATLEACVNDPAVKKEIMAYKKDGERLGVNATPTYFVNKEMVVGGRNLRNKLNDILKEIHGP